MLKICHYGCGAQDDLRPYGPNGSWVCFDCAMATPEREKEASYNYISQLERAIDASVTKEVELTENGPIPLNPKLS